MVHKQYTTKNAAEILELEQTYVTELCRKILSKLGEDYVVKFGQTWVITELGLENLKQRNTDKGRPPKKIDK